jgi:hypothetical protein
MSPIKRKAQTGEPTNNGGHFGSKANDESAVELAAPAAAQPKNFRLPGTHEPVTAAHALAEWSRGPDVDYNTIAAGRLMAEYGKKPSRRQVADAATDLMLGLTKHIEPDLDAEQVLDGIRLGAMETGLDLAKLGRPLPEPVKSALPGPRHEIRAGRLVSLAGDNYVDLATPDAPQREVAVEDLVKPIKEVFARAKAQGEFDPTVDIEVLTQFTDRNHQYIDVLVHVPASEAHRFLDEGISYTEHAIRVRDTAHSIVESFNRQGTANYSDRAFTTASNIRIGG